MEDRELVRRFYPESNVGGFSHTDGTVALYTQIAAVLRPTDRVLDFGAGRGGPLIDDPVAYRTSLQKLQGRCASVEGCDVDPVVAENPFLDAAAVTTPGEPLPYEDGRFDIIVSISVFEHIDDPSWLASELLRVLKPGGLIAAATPNKFGYIATAARAVPNQLHVRALRNVQPERKAHDVFPTRYRLNTARALRRTFGDHADVHVAYIAPEPAYHFGRPPVFRAVKWLNKHLPDALRPALLVFIRKHPS